MRLIMYILPLFFVADDFTVGLDAQRDRDAPGGVSLLSESMFMGRSLGISVTWGVHSYSSISQHIRTNTENLLVVGAQGDDLAMLARAMGLDGEQSGKLRMLERGEAVVYAPGTWPKALYGRFPYVGSDVSEDLLRAGAQAFLQQIVAEKGGPQEPTAPKDAMDADALRLAVEAGFHPYRSVTGHYQRVGLDRLAGRKALEWLQNHAFAKAHKVSPGKRGGQLSLIEITPIGWAELTARGFQHPAPVGRGDFLHSAVATALSILGHRDGHAVQVERAFGNVFGDVIHETRDGRLIVHQIGMSNPKWEVNSLQRLLRSAGITELVLVLRDKNFQQKVSALLQGKFSKEEQARLRFTTAGAVLEDVQ
jgi:hypothetical protein